MKSVKLINSDFSPKDDKIIRFIVDKALDVFGISLNLLFNKTRKFVSADARMSCYFIIYNYTDLSITDIANLFKKTHPLIYRDIKRLMSIKKDDAYKDYISKHNILENKVKKYKEQIV